MGTENTVVDGGSDGGDEGSSDVTYVGGRAVEQTTEGEAPAGEHGDELAAAKAAVKAAIQEEGKKAAKEAKAHLAKDPMQPRERGPDGKFLPADEATSETADAKAGKPVAKPKEAEDADEADRSELRRTLDARKEQAKFKAEAAAEVEKLRNEARSFYQQLQQERAELQREKSRLEMLKKDPLKAIRENGWDPEEFILDIASDGTPEGKARRQQREYEAKIAELEGWRKEQQEASVRQQEEAEKYQKAQFRNNVEQEFLRTAGSRKEDGNHRNPHLVAMYKDDPASLVSQADHVAERYRAATGRDATFGEIAEYLEERAAKWYKSISNGSAPQDGAPVTKGKPTPGSATGKRSLSPSGSSERRSLGTALKDLDGDERLAAARDAVRVAIHEASGR